MAVASVELQRRGAPATHHRSTSSIINAIQRHLMPPDATLLKWLRDASFETLNDGCSATGEEALRDAANRLTWRVCNDAVEFVCAIGRSIAPAA